MFEEQPTGLPLFDLELGQSYPQGVIRFFIGLLAALALAFSPAAASSAMTAPSAMPGCTMDGHMPAKPADHTKMDCCNAFCQAAAAWALLPERNSAAEPLKSDGARHARTAVTALPSFKTSGLDPPPRLLS